MRGLSNRVAATVVPVVAIPAVVAAVAAAAVVVRAKVDSAPAVGMPMLPLPWTMLRLRRQIQVAARQLVSQQQAAQRSIPGAYMTAVPPPAPYMFSAPSPASNGPSSWDPYAAERERERQLQDEQYRLFLQANQPAPHSNN